MLYGKETSKAIINFPFSIHRVHLELILAVIRVKQASALANFKDGKLTELQCKAIYESCIELLSGTYNQEFVTPAIQGGAGTSINMNVNEVIAKLATQKAGEPINPYDQVNISQSTNDVNPSALKIACIDLLSKLFESIDQLIVNLGKKSEDFITITKLARTHLQDAIPTTLGAEFGSYQAILLAHREVLNLSYSRLHELNLGGTAIGSGINASDKFRDEVYNVLNNIIKTETQLRPAANLMSKTSSNNDIVQLSGLITAMMVDLSKIATDLRILSSGPRGGLGEIKLQELQNGSSIMPGKINPVIPEVVNQAYAYCSGKNLTIQIASEQSNLELGVMFPVIADSIISVLKITTEVISQFAKCVDSIAANENICKLHLENSTAYATLLTPKLGYETVSKLVREAVDTNNTLREVVINGGYISSDEFERIVNGN